MKLEEYIKYLEAAGYHVSGRYDTTLNAVMIIIRRGNYQISGYICDHTLFVTLPENERNTIIFDFIKENVKKLDTQINDFLEETFYK